MALSAGSSLGSYEILSPLGAGGMGEVYRARDTKLGRDVAIKILPDAFAQDPERLARFQREAQMLAALNHPHIAAIYGLDEVAGARFLVLELIDGESLAQRLEGNRGSGLGMRDALAIARQIVDALEAAHEKGIVHRDLKPANIMLTADGQAKVLDFGLAKIEAGGTADASGLTHSPTLTFAATQAGVILGTAAYMSPEQAKGRPADKRSDVWAFGCVLFEMVAGKRAFEGEDVSDTLAAILRAEPDWNAFPTDVPAHIRAIITRCLAKDRKTRIPDISVVRFMLDEPIPTQTIAPAVVNTRHRSALGWKAATALLAVTTMVATAGWYASRPAMPAATRFFVYPPENVTFVTNAANAPSAIISPDGRTLAFTARNAAGKVMLWLRPIDSLAAQPLAGSEDAAYPFWSPDSRTIAYFTRTKLMKIEASGGPPQVLCDSAGGIRGGSWNRNGVIVMNGGPGQPLRRVSSSGGDATPTSLKLLAGQSGHSFPFFLPDGRHVLYYAGASSSDARSGVYVGSLDTGESRRILAADSSAVFSAQSGHLLFVRQGTLMTQPFDQKTLTSQGEPVPIAERVGWNIVPGVVTFSVSDNGALAYGVTTGQSGGAQLGWIDRQGKPLGPVGTFEEYRGLDLSPDGRQIAAHRHEGSGGDIWVSDASRGAAFRFTFDAAQDNSSPVWSPDGSRIVFGALRNGKWGLYEKTLAGEERSLVESTSGFVLPTSWSSDGQSIVYVENDPKTLPDLWRLPLSGDRKPVPVVRTPFIETHGEVSPDGKWLAYASNDTGRFEIYVQAFPQGGRKYLVSANGGTFPRWRADGRELFYMFPTAAGKIWAVNVKPNSATFDIGPPRELFDSGYVNQPHSGPYNTFAVSADGQRFLIPRPASSNTSVGLTPIAVVVNWTAGLKR